MKRKVCQQVWLVDFFGEGVGWTSKISPYWQSLDSTSFPFPDAHLLLNSISASQLLIMAQASKIARYARWSKRCAVLIGCLADNVLTNLI